jgi:predicted O-methyltransferase YrrM
MEQIDDEDTEGCARIEAGEMRELPFGVEGKFKEYRKLKVFIPVIDNGMGLVTANYAVALYAAINQWSVMEMEKGRIIEVDIRRVSGSHADRSMNVATADFLASDADEMLIIDTDIVVNGQQLFWLFEHDLPLVYGAYSKKQVQEELCLCRCARPDEPNPDAIGGKPPHDSLYEVRRAGRGFMRVRRDFFEALWEHFGNDEMQEYLNHGRVEKNFWKSGAVMGCFTNTGNMEWLSEDWMLCEFARYLGTPIWMDKRIYAQHEGFAQYPLTVSPEALARMLTKFTPAEVSEARAKANQWMKLEPPKKWQSIFGWFSEEDAEIFKVFAEKIPNNEIVAEVGSFLGRSTAALATAAKAQNKTFTICAVDTFKGTISEGKAHADIVKAHGGSLRDAFAKNMDEMGVDVIIHEQDSVSAAETFPSNTLDAVFIDGEHTYKAVYQDLVAWYRALKPGGIIAGHDYDYPEVKEAVMEFLGPNVQQIGRCWLTYKDE